MDENQKSEIVAALQVLIDEAKSKTEGVPRRVMDGTGEFFVAHLREVVFVEDLLPNFREHHAAPVAFAVKRYAEGRHLVSSRPAPHDNKTVEQSGEIIAEFEDNEFRAIAVRPKPEHLSERQKAMANPIRWVLHFMVA